MKITYLGHSSFSIEAHGKTLILDPYISANELAADIVVDTLEADYILVTHAHGDHTLDVERIAKRTKAVIISNFEIAEYYKAKGYEAHPMNHGGTWNFDFGKVHMVNAVHSSSFPDGHNGGNPAGFVLETSNHKIYIAGDTALTQDMKLIPMMLGEIDLSILPIGDDFTMGIDSAIKAADFVGCHRVLGCHYDTFGYIKIDKKEAFTKFAKKGKELTLLPIGNHLKL